MRISILSPAGRSGNPQHGGIETVAENLANEFGRQNHTVDLLVYPSRGCRPSVGVINSNVNIIVLDGQHKQTLARATAEYSRKYSPDILLAASYRANIAACWAKSRLPRRTHVFVSEHNTPSEEVRDNTWITRKYRFHLIKKNYRKVDGIIAVSNGVAQDLQHSIGLDATQIKVIYNPIVTTDTSSLASEPVDHPWLIEKSTPIVLGAGRLAKQKDFPTLLRAFAEVRADRHCRLVILGEGEERNRLQRLAVRLGVDKDFDMPGFVANPFAYMQRADVFALSSIFEGFGNVIAEALSVGTPVVATDCRSGPREILADGAYGQLVPVGDSSALAQSIQYLLDTPPNRYDLQARAHAFSAETIAKQYLVAFNERRTNRSDA